eukprot:1198125-Alexandrium_andersonii.AAC.1
MDKDSAVDKCQESLGLSRIDALAKWDAEEENAAHSDLQGKGGSVPIPSRSKTSSSASRHS